MTGRRVTEGTEDIRHARTRIWSANLSTLQTLRISTVRMAAITQRLSTEGSESSQLCAPHARVGVAQTLRTLRTPEARSQKERPGS